MPQEYADFTELDMFMEKFIMYEAIFGTVMAEYESYVEESQLLEFSVPIEYMFAS